MGVAANDHNTNQMIPTSQQIEIGNLVRQAGKIAQSTRKVHQYELKNDGSLVTAADRNVETFLRGELTKLVPGSGVWGEEEGFTGSETEPIWLVDPVDGTSNFVYGSPLWGVTAALVRDGRIELGAIALPDFDEIYTFELGHGASCNGTPLPAIPPGHIRPEELVSYPESFSREFPNSRVPGKNRYSGAFVIEGLWVARQRFRGMISDKANLYDAAATIGICRELGADVRYADGSELDIPEVMRQREIIKPFIIFPRDSGWTL